MNNYSEISDLIDIEVSKSDLNKSRKIVRGFTKLNHNIRTVTEEPSIVEGNIILRISVPRNSKESWILAIEAQFENDGVAMEILG